MKRFLTILLVAATIGASWLIYSRDQTAQATVPEGIKTEVIGRDVIEATVSAIGNLTAQRTQTLSFAAAGRAIEVVVEEGDEVHAGQLLARLDSSDLELSVKQAEAAVRVSEASLTRARKGPRPEEIAAAEAAVLSAKANLEEIQKGPSARDKQLAQLSIDQAKNSLWGAQGSRDAIKGNPLASGSQLASAEAQIANAEIGIQVAEINYAKLLEPTKESMVRSAEAQLAKDESSLARLLAMPSKEDIDLAEAQLAQARISVEIARSRLDDMVLQAPFSGQLVSWDLYRGDNVTPGAPVGTLVDVSRYHIDMDIDETEISKLEVGSQARITLDAFPDQELGGRVSRISLAGRNAQGIVSYGVRIELSPPDLPVRPLMTAAISVVVARKENSLLVPNRAMRRDKGGKYVEVLRDNVPTKVYITTGVSSEDYTEVVEGLAEGDEVVVSRPRESIFSGGPFGGG